MSRRFNIINYYTDGFVDRGLIMLPVGAYYNKDLQSAKRGDLIKIYAGEPYCEIKRITYLLFRCANPNM